MVMRPSADTGLLDQTYPSASPADVTQRLDPHAELRTTLT